MIDIAITTQKKEKSENERDMNLRKKLPKKNTSTYYYKQIVHYIQSQKIDTAFCMTTDISN
jgi:hypothetical protein